MKSKNLVIIGTVESLKYERDVTGYVSNKTGRWVEQYPICLKCGSDYSDDYNVPKEIYEKLTEGRKYAFLGKYDNTGKYPSQDIDIIGFAVPTSLDLSDDFIIIPQSEYNTLVASSASGKKSAETK